MRGTFYDNSIQVRNSVLTFQSRSMLIKRDYIFIRTFSDALTSVVRRLVGLLAGISHGFLYFLMITFI